MNYKRDLTLDIIKSKILYDQYTGEFRRLPSAKIIEFSDSNTSRLIKVTHEGKQYRIPAYNLAWFYVYGVYPDGILMHRNMDKSDFRIENLKQVTIKHFNRANLIYKDYIEGYKPKQHETDVHKYVVRYYDGKQKWKIFQDYVLANAFSDYIKVYIKRKLQQLGVIVD